MRHFFVVALLVVAVTANVAPLPLHGARPPASKWASVAGANVNPFEEFTVRMGLPRRNMDKVQDHLDRASDPLHEAMYGRHYTMEELASLVVPDPAHTSAVHAFLQKNGITHYHASSLLDSFSFTATAATIERMFSVRFAVYGHKVSGRRVSRALGEVSLPRYLHAAVDLVAGFRGFPVAVPLLLKKTSTVGSPDDNVTPQIIFSTYNITTFPAADASNTQSFFQAQAQYVDATDLSGFCSKYFNSSSLNCSIARFIGVNPPNKAGVESSLDSQYIMGVNKGQVQTWVFSYSNDDFCADLATWGQDVLNLNGTRHPYVISMSYGTQDLPNQCMGADVVKLNQDVMMMASIGISVVIASGDSGSGYDLFYLNPSWPASIPYATAVGSTTFITAGSPLEEATTEFGSGGGFSFDYNDSTQFTWQTAAVNGYFSSGVTLPPANLYMRGGRGTPDVAALGQDFNILDKGRSQQVSGTSASTPTFASIVSMLNNERLKSGKSLGFLNPFLYKNPQAFRDVTVGNNAPFLGQGWTCAKGWDPVTGLGTPNFPELIKAVQALNARDALREKK